MEQSDEFCELYLHWNQITAQGAIDIFTGL